MKKETDDPQKLAEMLAQSYSLNELSVVESAVKAAREIKSAVKANNVPAEEIEKLKEAWAKTQHKTTVEIPITVVIEIASHDSDSCSVYPSIIKPDFMSDWDAYDLLTEFHVEYVVQTNKAVEKLKELLNEANALTYKLQDKYDVPASTFL
jgi:hypothetical protein